MCLAARNVPALVRLALDTNQRSKPLIARNAWPVPAPAAASNLASDGAAEWDDAHQPMIDPI